MESLPAVCPIDGCTWKGTLKEYEVKMPVCGTVTEAQQSGVAHAPPAVGSRPRSPSGWDLVLHVFTGAEACLMSVEEETELLLRVCPFRNTSSAEHRPAPWSWGCVTSGEVLTLSVPQVSCLSMGVQDPTIVG